MRSDTFAPPTYLASLIAAVNDGASNGFRTSSKTEPIERRSALSSEHLPALDKAIELPRGHSTSRGSPPNEAAPPGPRHLDIEPHLLFGELQPTRPRARTDN
jgi:hypothetical protein